MKRATYGLISQKRACIFISIHALVKRATRSDCLRRQNDYNFNPRPREKGDHTTFKFDINIKLISIHALVKRATFICDNSTFQWNISIHALVKRATDDSSERRAICEHFNPRPREKGDKHSYTSKNAQFLFQSTPS